MMTRSLHIDSTLVLKNLCFRPVRSVLTASGIAIACCVYVLLLIFVGGFEGSWRDLFSSRSIDLFVVERGKVDPLTSSLDEGIAERIGAMDAVQAVYGSLADLVTMDGGTDVLVVGYDAWSPYYDELAYLDGGRPKGGREAVIARDLSRATGLGTGDTVELEFEPFTILGVFEPRNDFEASSLVVDVDALRRLRGVGRIYSSIGVRLEPGRGEDAAEAIRTTVEREHPGTKVTTTAEFFRNNRMFRSLGQMVTVVSLLAFGLVLLSCMNTMGMAVLERTGEIGILRTLGWTAARIAGVLLAECLVLCLLGWLAGCGAALGIVLFLRKGSALMFLPSDLEGAVFLRALLLCLLGGLAGTFHPAYKAVTLEPADACDKP